MNGERTGIDQHLAEIETALQHQLDQVQHARTAMRKLVDGDRPMVSVSEMERELRRQRFELSPPTGSAADLFDNRLSESSDFTPEGLGRAINKLRADAPFQVTPDLAGDALLDAQAYAATPTAPGRKRATRTRKAKGRAPLSAAGKAAISRAAKARWAAYRKAKAAKASKRARKR